MKLSLGKCWGLLIFDMIGLAISGYAFLLVYQIITTLSNANAFIILMGFFVGIKVVVLSLYDLNRNMLHKNIPFLGALISVLGNGIIFGLCWFLIPEVPATFFIGLAIIDFLMVTLCHLLWWVLIGKDEEIGKENGKVKEKVVKKKEEAAKMKEEVVKKKKGAKEKKTWLAPTDDEESEYDSIFTSLLENEKKGQKRYPEPENRNVFEEEKRYQTSDFLDEIKQNLKKDHQLPEERSGVRAPSVFQSPSQKPGFVEKKIEPELPGKKKDEINDHLPINKNNEIAEPFQKTTEKPALSPTNSLSTKDTNELFVPFPNVQRKENTVPVKSEDRSDNALGIGEPTVEREEDFLSIERRLSYLFNEIEKSMKETQYLQSAVGAFQKEVETYTPITGDEKIIATGNLIREKLKMIIDKQFVVDEVLDDLIRLSKLINNRINDLDVIEAGLNQRKIALDQKDVLFVEGHGRGEMDTELEIMPEEVVLENLDSEFIVAGDDYETVRKYLIQNPEK
ncbi:hypothetical protein GH810_13270 [Acetobacterium paludosum]|uniref:Uncharacterized protein n=1 Tax=Acetobacterium paludosum TaxID=52693 RepID=A0A923HY36_9FIRM|nr:hypothetical protein [Acetobacterium paludosum]MBC3889285.1 hypothetical protein [Acetobacterium paludosum]